MAIKTQEIITSPSNYAVVNSADVKGGLNVVSQVSELEDIPLSRLVDGSQAYVTSERKYYKYSADTNTWSVFNTGSVLIGDDEKDAVDGTLFLKGENIDVADLISYLNFLKTQIETLKYVTQEEFKSEDLTKETLSATDFEVYKTYSFGNIYKVKHIGFKTITKEALDVIISQSALGQYFIDAEPIWQITDNIFYLYRQGTLYEIQGNGTGGGNSSSSQGTLAGNGYVAKIDAEGVLKVYPTTGSELKTPDGRNIDNDASLAMSGKNFALLFNSIYAGGEQSNEHSYLPVSHNFIELVNLSDKEFNLDDIYLYYKSATNLSDIKYVKLVGTIKPWSTYLVRGAQCSVNKSNKTLIHIDDYDAVFLDSDNKPLKLSTEGFCVCLSATTPEDIAQVWSSYTATVQNKDPQLIDLFGAKSSNAEISGTIFCNNSVFNKLSNEGIMYRPYPADGARVPKKFRSNAYTDTGADYNLSYSNKWDMIKASSRLFMSYKPCTTKEGKTVLFDKSTIQENASNYFNILFGEKATASTTVGATRTFTWVSYNQYDEGVSINNIVYISGFVYNYGSSASNGRGPLLEDVDGEVYNTSNIFTEIDGIPVTVHKVIIKNIPAGTYEAKVVRPEQDSYRSNTLKFTVKADADVNEFSFVQTSDQQAFTELDYQVWGHISKLIADSETPDFMINTGDITQNGNRVNEWLDYYKYKNEKLHAIPEMSTIGNNDLAPADIYKYKHNGGDANKNNSRQMRWFYTFDYTDSQKVPNFVREDGKKVFIDSCYFYDYGKFRFICVNSEITNNAMTNIYGTSKNLYDDFMLSYLESVATTDKNKILYCHEMPFTIIAINTWRSNYLDIANGANKTTKSEGTSNDEFQAGTYDRSGSHLNYVPVINKFKFQKMCEALNIKLVIGGHKHTYSISYPILENIKNTMSPIIVLPQDYTGTLVKVKCPAMTADVVYILPSDWNTGISPFSGNLYNYSEPSNRISDVPDSEGFYTIAKPPMCTYMTYQDWQADEELKKQNPIVYVMAQATGQKLQSNKEQPIPGIGFLKQYTPAKLNTEDAWIVGGKTLAQQGISANESADTYNTKVTAQAGQKHPTFVVYKVNDNTVTYSMHRTTNLEGTPDTVAASVDNAAGINNGKWRICTEAEDIHANFTGTIVY